MSDLVGRVLGQYEIVAELGHGGMANVYRATQSSMDREVAIKVLPAHFLQDRTFIERFTREVKVIAKLQHPRILPVYDYGEAEGMPYIVMALLPGGTLADRVKQQGALPFGEAARLLHQLAEGLEYAHEHGIIHRDFKPSNVLLDAKGNAYLADFGIAKVTQDTAQLTGSGMVGTPAYMAPEMSRPGGLSPLVDVYALGVTLYQMLAGQQPYRADTPIGVMMAHATEPIPDARSQRADLPDAVQAVIERAMAKDPAARYATPGALAADFEAALAGAPLSAPAAMAADDGSTVQMMGSQHGLTTPVVPFGSHTSPGVVDTPTVKEGAKAVAPIRIGGLPVKVVIGVVVGMGLLAALIVLGVVPMVQNLAGASATPEAGSTTGGESSDRLFNFRYFLEEHTGAIAGLAFSPDGTLLATASQDKTLKLWQASDGAPELQIESDRPLESVAFSPDGNLLLAAQFEQVGVWDAHTGAALDPFGGLAGNTLDAAIAPDGGHAVVGTADNQAVRWHPDGDGDVLTADLWGPVNAVAWSPDSDRFAAGDDMGKLGLYAVEDLSDQRLIDAGAAILDVAYNPDGDEIATLTGDSIRIWETDSGAELRRMNSVPAGMRAIDWSAEGGLIAGGGESKTVIVWDADTGEPLQTIAQHEGTITAVAFSPDSAVLASGDETGKAIVWQREDEAATGGGSPASGGLQVTLRQPLGSATNGAMRHVAYAADGSRIVTGAESAVIIWDAKALMDNYVLDIGTPARAPDVAITSDNYLVMATVDNEVRVWLANGGQPDAPFGGHSGYPVALAVSPDGELVMSGGEDGLAILSVVRTRRSGLTRSFDPETVTALAYSPQESQIAIGLSSGEIVVVKDDDPSYLVSFKGHVSTVNAVAFSPDGQTLASASNDGTVKLWDANSGELKFDLPGDGSIAYGVAYSPDGSFVAASTENGNLLFWDAVSGDGLGSVDAADSAIYDLAFSPDGATLVIAPEDGQATVWDVARDSEPTEAPTEPPAVQLPDGITGQIAFVSDQDGNQEIYLLNLDDMSQTNLTNDPGKDFSPAYAPNSASLAFVSDRLGEVYTNDLFVMEADGSNPTAIFPDQSGVAYPTWSPDSLWIAYSAYVNDPGGYAVWKAMADGSQQTVVADTPTNDWVSDWTPDGVHIAFFNSPDDPIDQLFIVCECGGDTVSPLTTLDEGENRFAAWSPDGSKIAFESNRDGNWAIWVMNSDLSGLFRLTPGLSPSWSPDGQFIVFASDFETEDNDELYIIGVDGAGLTRLTYTGSNNTEPEWRP